MVTPALRASSPVRMSFDYEPYTLVQGPITFWDTKGQTEKNGSDEDETVGPPPLATNYEETGTSRPEIHASELLYE